AAIARARRASGSPSALSSRRPRSLPATADRCGEGTTRARL
ncbi:MAG: hypothetical protein AVDCRST_MAG53-487, partial [uncultured Solirubrobacteraceae bacterium]